MRTITKPRHLKRWVLGVCTFLLVAGFTVASAASLGPLTVDRISTATASTVLCDASVITVSPRTGFRESRYEIISVQLGAVPAACREKPYELALANISDGARYGDVVTIGTLDAGGAPSILIDTENSVDIDTFNADLYFVLYIKQ